MTTSGSSRLFSAWSIAANKARDPRNSMGAEKTRIASLLHTAHPIDSGAVPSGRETSNTPSWSHRYSYVATALLFLSQQRPVPTQPQPRPRENANTSVDLQIADTPPEWSVRPQVKWGRVVSYRRDAAARTFPFGWNSHLLGAFRHEHPWVEVRLGVVNRPGVYNRFVAGEVDFVISGRRIVRPFLTNERIAIEITAPPTGPPLAGDAGTTGGRAVHRARNRERAETGYERNGEEALQAAGLGVRPVIRLTGASVLRTRRSSDSSIATGGGRRSGVPWPPNEISTEASRTARLSGRSLASRPAEVGVEEPGCDRYLPRGWRVNSPPGGGDLATVTTVLPSRGQVRGSGSPETYRRAVAQASGHRWARSLAVEFRRRRDARYY